MDEGFETLRYALATNVVRLRKAKALSQEELAFNANIDRTYVSQVERSVNNPSLRVLYRLSAALDTTVLELLTPARQRPP
jgi:transcriptional regulator with XRE-family HTH domain